MVQTHGRLYLVEFCVTTLFETLAPGESQAGFEWFVNSLEPGAVPAQVNLRDVAVTLDYLPSLQQLFLTFEGPN